MPAAPAGSAPLHVLAVPDRPAPRMVVAPVTGGPPISLDLTGHFAFRAGPVRLCVGDWRDGVHVPCPTAEPVSRHRQCGPCSGLEDQECIFEPRCAKDPPSCTCVSTFKGVPHVVYLAFHGTLPKVGLTQVRRVENRLREQGADAWFAVQHCPDRATARQVEIQVSFLYGFPEHRSHRETLPQLARPVPWEVIARRADEARLRLEGNFEVERTLHRIDDHPIAQPVGGVPHRVLSEGLHRGTWLGIKGANLLYRESPRPSHLATGQSPIAAIKRSDLVGRRIEFTPT